MRGTTAKNIKLQLQVIYSGEKIPSNVVRASKRFYTKGMRMITACFMAKARYDLLHK